MEIRCGGCNKLFRVSDDKITGKGIKFACTKCGEPIKITREDFENYTLSQTAVTALDQFESKAKHAAVPEPGAELTLAEVTAAAQPSAVSAAGSMASIPAAPKAPDVPVSATPDFLQEQPNIPPSEPSIFAEQPLQADAGHLREPEPTATEGTGLFEAQQEKQAGAKQDARAEVKEEPKREPEPEAEPKSAAKPPEPAAIAIKEEIPEKKLEQKPAVKPEQKPQSAQEIKTAPAAAPKTEQKPAVPPRPVPAGKPVSGAPAPAGRPPVVKKEAARPAAPPVTVIGASPAQPARSGRMIIIVVLLIVFVLAGAGVFYYLRSAQKPASEPPAAMTSVAGLHILSAAGSIEPNGDLLISGEIENTTDKEQRAWYIVVDVYDANGTVIQKLRLLNGKQIYTRNDYDIMARRGINIKDIKAQILAQQGIAIPPRGKVPFEIRYLEPPKGVASFNSSLHPFDPIRLYQEVADEAK